MFLDHSGMLIGKQRKRDSNGGALPHCSFSIDRPTMGLNDSLHCCEAVVLLWLRSPGRTCEL